MRRGVVLTPPPTLRCTDRRFGWKGRALRGFASSDASDLGGRWRVELTSVASVSISPTCGGCSARSPAPTLSEPRLAEEIILIPHTGSVTMAIGILLIRRRGAFLACILTKAGGRATLSPGLVAARLHLEPCL
jgi:hypothetical protein